MKQCRKHASKRTFSYKLFVCCILNFCIVGVLLQMVMWWWSRMIILQPNRRTLLCIEFYYITIWPSSYWIVITLVIFPLDDFLWAKYNVVWICVWLWTILMVFLPHLFQLRFVKGLAPIWNQIHLTLLRLGHCHSVLLCMVIPTMKYLQQKCKKCTKKSTFITLHKSPTMNHANLRPKRVSGAWCVPPTYTRNNIR